MLERHDRSGRRGRVEMKHGWTSDRAIGFVVGVGASFMAAVGLMHQSPLPFVLAIVLIVVGVFVPSIPSNR